MMTIADLVMAGALAALGTMALIPLLMPLLRRYALARPNARSSHVEPTPQGAGAALVPAIVLAAGGVAAAAAPALMREVLIVSCAAALLAAVGAWDDIRPMHPVPRLAFQIVAVVLVVTWGPADTVRLFPALPVGLEWALVVLAGVWFVNLTNFMDGMDMMTAAGLAPAMLALTALCALGLAPAAAGLLAAALLGGLAGFLPFNRHPARVFLGDVGSLPIGLIAGYALYRFAGSGHLVAALTLPAYYLADATITLGRRAWARRRVWQAHREHFYQRALDGGLPAPRVALFVGVCNAVLAALAVIATVADDLTRTLSVIAALVMVAGILILFAADERGRR